MPAGVSFEAAAALPVAYGTAHRMMITHNTVKSYIRSIYRKIGVASRTQAVLWGIENGFKPDTLRTIDPALLVRPALKGPGACVQHPVGLGTRGAHCWTFA